MILKHQHGWHSHSNQAVGTGLQTGFVHQYHLCVCVCLCWTLHVFTCLSVPSTFSVVCACVCVCAFLQEVNPYSTVTSDPNELDRRYCVLKLHVPYGDLVHSPYTNSSGQDSSTVTFWPPHSTLIHHPCSRLAAASLFICFFKKVLLKSRDLVRRRQHGADSVCICCLNIWYILQIIGPHRSSSYSPTIFPPTCTMRHKQDLNDCCNLISKLHVIQDFVYFFKKKLAH